MLLLLIFALMSILVFTALAIERILKDIRSQNNEIISLLKTQQGEKRNDKTPI